MMDPGQAADIADRMHERELRRVWPPPDPSRGRPPPPQQGSSLEIVSNSIATIRAPGNPAQLMGPDRFRLQRGAEHLHRLGPRAIAEALKEIGDTADCLSGVLELLDAWRAQPTRETIAAVGADRFPPEIAAVPR